MNDLEQLAEYVRELAVIPGRVTLASGKEADYYIDMRRVTLSGRAGPIVGKVMVDLVSDWDFDAVGGLTLGADPVATAMLHASAATGAPLDAFVVRKEAKAHGLQRRIEGADVAGKRVLVVEDTSTTGGSALTAVGALQDAGAEVIGVAVVVDRDTGAAERISDAGLPYRYALNKSELGLL
ncbi:MAG: orotate phosphoribosyltransferase [Propionibacteriales bacterium]|nr:MAG: orotate phosphoribosyltransferase [Propionibacteriales bacterium]